MKGDFVEKPQENVGFGSPLSFWASLSKRKTSVICAKDPGINDKRRNFEDPVDMSRAE